MRKVIYTLILTLVPGLCLADDHTRVAAMYKCKLHDGHEAEEVMAANKKWLVNARKAGGSEEINSYMMEPEVGDFGHFLFIDSYPDLATWAKVQDAGDTAESQAVEAMLDGVMECEKSRLYTSSKTNP